MGKIVSNFFISLDGVIESPDQWHFPYFNDEMGAAIDQGTEASAVFLMGRVLYEEWASYWPNAGAEGAEAPPGEPEEAANSFASFPLQLVGHETFETGVLNLAYTPAAG